jgi:hypothetical protein
MQFTEQMNRLANFQGVAPLRTEEPFWLRTEPGRAPPAATLSLSRAGSGGAKVWPGENVKRTGERAYHGLVSMPKKKVLGAASEAKLKIPD